MPFTQWMPYGFLLPALVFHDQQFESEGRVMFTVLQGTVAQMFCATALSSATHWLPLKQINIGIATKNYLK